jgi:hypothetical protein
MPGERIEPLNDSRDFDPYNDRDDRVIAANTVHKCGHRFLLPSHTHRHTCCRWPGHLGEHFCQCGAALEADDAV